MPGRERELAKERSMAEGRQRFARRKSDVADHLQRLGGRTRDDVTGDPVRGPTSPLGGRKKSEGRAK
jgi:hypothetical protein